MRRIVGAALALALALALVFAIQFLCCRLCRLRDFVALEQAHWPWFLIQTP